MKVKCYGICTEMCGAYKNGKCSIHATKADTDGPIIEAVTDENRTLSQ